MFSEHLIAGRAPEYAGLRMRADEYLALPDDGYRYELIDGVVVMSPSPIRLHQRILTWLASALYQHVETRGGRGAVGLGEVLAEIDVRFGPDLVYRPELIFVRSGRLPEDAEIIDVAPDLVVEILSPTSRRSDLQTKKGDYEKAGVLEYWVVDPEAASMMFFRLVRGAFQSVEPIDDRFASEAVPGFVLELAKLRSVCARR